MDLTWDQIQFVSESMMAHKIWMFNMVAEPVSQALGAQFKGGKLRRHRSKRQSNESKSMTAEQKDAMMMHNITAMGLPIATKE